MTKHFFVFGLQMITFLVVFSVARFEASELSWPVFHGLQGDNISKETGLLKTWPSGGPKLLWKAKELGDTEYPGYSGAVIAQGRVFTTGNKTVGNSVHSFVFALDESGGEILWSYDNGPAWTGHYPGDRSTPTLDGDRLYAFSAQGRLACLDLESGREKWARSLRKEAEAELPKWAYAESVVVDGEKLICWPGGKKIAVLAMDKMTGKTIWSTPGSESVAGYATTAIIEQDGLRIYANMNQKGLLAVDAQDGRKLFFYDHQTQYDINATMPYYQDGKILISSGYGSGTELLRLTVSGKNASVEPIWREKKLDNQHGGLIVLDGYIYGSAHHYRRGMWLCLKWEDGSVAWEDRGVGQGSIACGEGLLYCLGETGGEVALVRPNPEKYDEIARFTLPEEGEGKFWAHPAICGGKLFLRHAGFLYCYDIDAR